MSDGWTPERVEMLKQLLAENFSFSEIASRLGGEISRSGVAGKVARMGLNGLSQRPGATHAKHTPRHRGPVFRPVIVKAEPPVFLCEPEAHADGPVCRYMNGHPTEPGWQYCGHPVAKPGTSWCSFHSSIVWEPQRTEASRRKYENAEAHAAKSDAAMRRAGLG